MGILRECGRFLWRHIFIISLLVGASLIICAGALVILSLSQNASFADKAQIAAIVLAALGLLSLILLLWQLRQTAAWHKVLSYHQFFGDLPKTDVVKDLATGLRRLGIPEPTGGYHLSKEDAKRIWADEGELREDGQVVKGSRRAMRDYLNDFEEFCGAVRAGVINENYARNLEGTRTINAFFAFKEFIELTQDEAEKAAEEERKAVVDRGERPYAGPYRRIPYHELSTIAHEWRACREKDFTRLVKKNARSAKKEAKKKAKERQFDGVSPGV